MNTADLGNDIEYEQDILPIGTDSVILASFALPVRGRVCDLGCGAGAVMLLMALRGGAQYGFDGIEIRPDAAELARANIARAGLESYMSVKTADMRKIEYLIPSGEYAVVVSNPPYMPCGGSIPPDNPGARIARTEECCTLDDLCRAASYLLKYGGRFYVVYPPARLSELMRVMREHKLEPKRLRLFCRNKDSSPSLVLVEGRKNGREGIIIMPSLYQDSEEFDKIGKTF